MLHHITLFLPSLVRIFYPCFCFYIYKALCMKGGRLDGIGKPVSDASTLEKSADLKGVSCVEVICIIWTGEPEKSTQGRREHGSEHEELSEHRYPCSFRT